MLVIVGLSAAVWAYFHLKHTKKPALQAVSVLPDKAVCVLSSNDFAGLANKLTNQNLIWQELSAIHEFSIISKHLNYFDSVINENKTLKDFFSDRNLFLAVYNQNKANNVLITFNLNDEAQQEEFLKTISDKFRSVSVTADQQEFLVEKGKFYLRALRGVVAISTARTLLDEAFNEKNRKQAVEETYASLKQLMDKETVCNMYLDFSAISYANPKIKAKDFVFNGKAICDVEFNPDEVTFNGFNIPDSVSVLNTLSGQQAQPFDFVGILPFNLISYKAIGLSDYPNWKKKLNIPLEETQNFWKNINDSAMFNVERQLTENIGGKVLMVEVKHSAIISKALITEVRDTSEVNEILNYLSDSLRLFQSIKIAALKNKELAGVLYGNVFNISSTYAFVSGNYMVITETKETADYFINSVTNNAMATQNEVFMNYAKDNLNSPFNYQYYCSPAKKINVIKSIFGFTNEENDKRFEKFSDMSITCNNYKNTIQFRTHLKYQQSTSNKEIPGLWTFEADTTISSNIWSFINHKSNENELLIQDAKNNLYLINATGNNLWKKEINEPIASNIYTIDAFKNNKFQMLFNTANYLHLIDRNGNYVEGFPVKLPAKATNALVVFDYENTKEYRLLIACDDRTIYNFNVNGARNEKFAPIKTSEEVQLPVEYVKVGASDYLVACDVGGKIYVYSRRGAGRIDFSNKILERSGNYYVDAGNTIQNSRIIYLDDKNSLMESISLDDKKTVVKLPDEFIEASYGFEKIDDDKKTDIMILNKSLLKCYDLSGNELFAYENLDYTYKGASYFYDTDGAYFILSTIGGEVHLVPAASKSITKKIKGGGTPFVYDLFKDGKKYLLVSEDKMLKCVLLK